MHKKIDDGFDGLVSDLQKTLSYQTEASGYDPGCGASFRETYDGGTGRFPRYGQKLWIHYQEYRQYGGIYRYVGRCISSSIWTDVPSGRRSCRRPAKWIHPPYGGVQENGRIYGRGSLDDKGPAVVALHAMKAVRDSQNLKSRFRLIVGLDEETGAFRCMKRYLKMEEIPLYSFSPDGAFPLINAEKGILRLTD